jgi:hypothetical protein
VLVLLLAGSCDRIREPYLGAPGTTETHVLVEVRRGVVTADVWRLRSTVTTDGESSRKLLPEDPPSGPVSFPATYKVLARERTGQVAIMVEGLDGDGRIVGRASGVVDLAQGRGVQLALDLGVACGHDLDCDDTVFCNGVEACVDGACAPRERACPPSIHACVDISCSEEARRCATTARDDLCGVPDGDGGSPAAFYCDVALGCLAGRPEAPGLVGDPEVTPSIGKLGTLFLVAFTVSEPLAADPVVRVDVGGRRVALLLDEARTRRSEQRYAYTYTADGSEQAGRRLMGIDLVDLSGNAVTGLSGGGFTLDFTPPAVVGQPSLDNDVLMAGATARLDLTLSEPTAEPPEVRMGLPDTRPEDAPRAWTWSDGGDLARHRFTYVALGTETEGAHLLWLDAVDEAGNERAWVEVGHVVLDFTAPGVDGSATVLPPVASVGRTVVVEVPLTETIVGAPSLSGTDGSRALAFTPGDNAGRRLSFYHVMEEGEDGVYPLRLEGLVDAAGNESAPVVVGSVALDGTPPALVAYTQNLAALIFSDEFQVSFSASELLGPAPQVRLGPAEMVRTGTSTAPYVFRLRMAGTTLVGTFPVTVEIADVVGNRQSVTPGAVPVDAVPPTLVDAFFTPPVARLGITAYLSLTVSEMLRDAPFLGWNAETGDPGFTFATRSGVTYTYEMDVGPDAFPGVYLLPTVGLEDVAGNQMVAHPSDLGLVLDFTVDNRPPRVENLHANRTRYSAVAEFRDLVLTFDCSESVDVAPGSLAVTVAGFPLTCGPFQQTSPNYRCTRALTGEEPEGTGLLSVVATDRAGNVGTGNALVELDFGKPNLAYSSASPSLAKLGDTVVYVVTATEALTRTPVLHVTGSGSVTLAHRQGTAYIFSYAVTDALSDGEHAVTMDLEDAVGNVSTGLVGAGFKIDGKPPVVSAVTPDRARYSAAPGFDVVTIDVEVSEALPPGGLEVLVGTRPAACVPRAGGYRCSYQVLGLESEGLAFIKVSAADAAGNSAYESASFVFDFRVPTVVGGASVVLQPADCPLRLDQVTKANRGTVATLAFVVSESLSENRPLEVKLVNGQTTLTASLKESSGLFFAYEVTVPETGELTQGAYRLEIRLEDEVGNKQPESAPLVVPTTGSGFVLDTVAPGAPDVSTPDVVVYRRAPWGIDASRNGVVSSSPFQLLGAANAVDSETTWVISYDGADQSIASEIGRNAAARASPWVCDLNRADRAEIYVAAFDGACNHSAALKVRDVEWLATLGGKVSGSTVANPHIHRVAPVLAGALVQDPLTTREPTTSQLAALQTVDNQTLLARAQATWLERNTARTTSFSATDHAMVFDSARAKAVLFDGSEMWEWEPSTAVWSSRAAAGGKPPARSEHAMAYDAARNRVVLFGGRFSAYQTAGDTWEWDGDSGSWTERIPAGSRPQPRCLHSLAYDHARGTVLLFGGELFGGNVEYFGDTWEWDGASSTWTDRTPASSPAPRSRHALAYEPIREKVFMFGGSRDHNHFADAWEWSGAAGTWTQTNWEGDGPAARSRHTLAFDATRGTTVLYGGEGDAGPLSDLWEWDGMASAWTPRTGGKDPPARAGHSMVFEPFRGKVVVVGGEGMTDEVWEWDGGRGDWTNRTNACASPKGSDARMVFDSARGKVVVFSGSETWQWDGDRETWTNLDPPVQPSKRTDFAMAYDAARGVAVLFGGESAGVPQQDTWEWNGLDSTWVQRFPPTAPDPRLRHAMAFDGLRVVLFGGERYGELLADTWTWDGAAQDWVPYGGMGPPARRQHAMAHDVSNGRVILFGGYNGVPWYFSTNDTWQWDGDGWMELAPTHSPPERWDHAMAYDSARGRIVLIGGSIPYPPPNAGTATWEWDGTDWLDASPVGVRPSRVGSAMAFDAARSRVVMLEGTSGPAVWELAYAESRPGQLLQLAFATTGAPGAASFRVLGATFFAGGVGYPAGVATPGVELLVWDGGQWKAVGTNGGTPAAPRVLEWSETGSTSISRLLRRPVLDLAVRPAAASGSQMAEVAVDYAEVTVRYRLP